MFKILTHETPDLDAMMSVLLLKKFGNKKYPGINNAPVIFSSASNLPNNSTSQQLEKEGVIAVDIGGGKYDTHPTEHLINGKSDHSATDLVAKDLGVLELDGWKDLIEYSRLHDCSGHGLFSTNPIHHLTSINTILIGLEHINESDDSSLMEQGLEILQCIPYASNTIDEDQWIRLKEDLDKALDDLDIDVSNWPDYLEAFSRWYNDIQTQSDKIWGNKQLDRVVSVISIYLGALRKKPEQALATLKLCIHAIISREKLWNEALNSYDSKGVLKTFDQFKVATISDENGLVIKASRFRHKPALIIYRNPKVNSVTILLNKVFNLKKISFLNMVARIRITEAIKLKENIKYEKLQQPGTVHGWFLHQSLNFLIKGSKKQKQFKETLLSIDELQYCIYTELDNSFGDMLDPQVIFEYLKFQNPIFRK